MTAWEYNQLKSQITVAKRKQTIKMNQLKSGNKSVHLIGAMGNPEFRIAEANLNYLNNFFSNNKIGRDLKNATLRVWYMGSSDAQMRKAIQYRTNYINEMKKYSHLDNYEKLKKKLDNMTNPIGFYNWISQWDDTWGDLTWQSDMQLTQSYFNGMLADMGLLKAEWENEESE